MNALRRHDRARRVLIWAGGLAPIVFTIVYAIDGFIRPSYSAAYRPISDLGVGPNGLIQVFNFVVLGVLIVGLAASVPVPSQIAGRPGTILLALFGVGLIVAGIFVTDVGRGALTVHGAVHQFASFVAFNSLIATIFVTAWHARRLDRERPWMVYSLVSGLAVMIALAGFGYSMAMSGPAGLFERIAGTVGLAWVSVLAFRSIQVLHAGIRVYPSTGWEAPVL